MASVKDTVLFVSILAAGAVVLVGTGGVSLPGTQTSNIVCEIPLADSLDYCSASAQPGDSYKVSSNIVVNSGEISDTSFKYKTSKAEGSAPFSAFNPSLSVLGQLENAKVDYILKKDGVVLSSERKRLGTVGSFETKDVTFESKVKSGTYTVEYVLAGDQCNFLGCSGVTDKYTEKIEVPKLPLGEY